MQIWHSEAFCGSFFSLKTCTKLNHEKLEHHFFKLVPAGTTRKTSITCNFFRFLLSKSDGFVIFNGASQKFAIFYENLDFPQRRVQTFTPANGKPSVNKVVNNVNRFVEDCFIDDKHNLEANFMKNPSKKNCRFCEFNQTEHCDVGVK